MRKLTADEVKQQLDHGESLIFIDARSAESWGKSDQQIPGSLRVPPDEVEKFVAALPKEATMITYCT
jgi:rhodanese-related sulfurtransferase